MNTYTDEEITKGLTQEQIDITIEVLKQINFRSAYGHNATYCTASNKLLGLLDKPVTHKVEGLVYCPDCMVINLSLIGEKWSASSVEEVMVIS